MTSGRTIMIFLVALAACDADDPRPESDLEGYFEKVWNDFDQTYSYFELKGIDSVYSVNRP